MIALCMGISGLSKRQYIEDVAQATIDLGRSVHTVHVGDEIIDAANRAGFRVTSERILDLPPGALAGFRAAVFERILAEIAQQPADSIVLINSHGCFRWKDFLTPAFDLAYLRELASQADQRQRDLVFLALVDDVPAIWRRLEATAQWRGKLTLSEIATWQDEERFVTRTLASVLEKPFYLLAREEPIQNAVDLLTQPGIGKFYFSFPITSVPEDKRDEWKRDVADLRDEVRNQVLVFDPLAVRDLEWLAGRWAEDVVVPADELPLLRRVLEFQTVGRDLQLIDQADGVIVNLSESATAHSPGVQREIEHGHDTGKDVLVSFSGKVSPFLRYSATRVFETKEELLEYISANYPVRNAA
jgi:hypothetical protein